LGANFFRLNAQNGQTANRLGLISAGNPKKNGKTNNLKEELEKPKVQISEFQLVIK